MNPVQFAELAREMVTRSQAPATRTAEAEQRSAISRAYYAAFHVALDCLSTLEIEVTQSSKCHTVVRDGLNNCGDMDAALISVDLGTLYRHRITADYKLADTKIPGRADPMTTLAEEVIAKLRGQQQHWQADRLKRTGLATAILAWAKAAGQPLFPKK